MRTRPEGGKLRLSVSDNRDAQSLQHLKRLRDVEDRLCARAAELGMKALSITDHGVLYGLTSFFKQAEKHGTGLFGDISTKLKKLAIKHKDVLNPVIAGLKTGAKKGASKLAQAAQDKVIEYAQKAQDKIDNNLNPIEGGAIKRRRGKPKKGEGFGALLGPLVKLAAPVIIDAVAGAAKKKMGGGKRKAGRPKKRRSGGALYAPGE